MSNQFKFLMISAGFEHGGNVTQRYLDGHDALYVYPFESQLGNRYANDYLASLERYQYRYPEFPSNISPKDAYELFYDEELKTFLRKPNGSKFKNIDLQMSEEERVKLFCDYLKDKPKTRANFVEAFFKSTFDAWKNYKRSGKNEIYVGYSPIIGIDADRILSDFPNAHILHVIRNPFSAYSDTKRRPFPLTLKQYIISWNLYHHIVLMHKNKFPDNITIMRYEDLIENPEKALSPLCKSLNIEFSESMTYPSWNSENITDRIFPWGTINSAKTEENIEAINRLKDEERHQIKCYSQMLLQELDYNDLVA